MMLFSGIICVVIGIAIILFSIYGRRYYITQKSRCTSVVEGTLIRFVEKVFISDDNYDEVYYYPIYEYWLFGNRYEVQGSYGKRNMDVNLLGQKKQILYNPNNFEESFVRGEDLNFAYKIVRIIGIILLVAGICELIMFIALRLIK